MDDIGYFNHPESARAVARRIASRVAAELALLGIGQDFKRVSFCDVGAGAVQVDLESIHGYMGGFSMPYRIDVAYHVFGLPPRGYPRPEAAQSEDDAVERLVKMWPKDARTAAEEHRSLMEYFDRHGTD